MRNLVRAGGAKGGERRKRQWKLKMSVREKSIGTCSRELQPEEKA